MQVDVEELLRMLQELRERGLKGPLDKEEFKRYLLSRGLSTLTVLKNLKLFDLFTRFYASRVEEITGDVVSRFLERPRSVKTYNNYVTFLHHLGSCVGKSDLLSIKYRRPPIRPVVIPDDDELRRFRNVLQPKVRLVFDFLLCSGLRIWETMMLTRDRLEPFEDLYLVDARHIHKGRTKLSFFSFVIKEVGDRALDYSSRRYRDFLFHNWDSGLLSVEAYSNIQADIIRKKFYVASIKTGIKITPHTLRKVFTSKMLKSGMPLIMLAILQGRSLASNSEIKSYIDVRLLAKEYRQNINWIQNIIT